MKKIKHVNSKTFDCLNCWVTFFSKDDGPHVCPDCNRELLERPNGIEPYVGDYNTVPARHLGQMKLDEPS